MGIVKEMVPNLNQWLNLPAHLQSILLDNSLFSLICKLFPYTINFQFELCIFVSTVNPIGLIEKQ
jgi:hypothetical protein